ncbi:unannotated protein [freshwater metagenome]|uniref:Unannotated protein n=1 Tax=freshwater metagenome TaxID=449393 RepID=A0A6J6ZUU6_9ZZZZ
MYSGYEVIDCVAISVLATPFSRSALRTAAATLEASERADLLLAAIAVAVALRRTASGVTFTVPSAFTEMERVGAAAIDAGASANPPIKESATEAIANFFIYVGFIGSSVLLSLCENHGRICR